MNLDPKALEAAIDATEAEFNRDFDEWASRWTYPGGLYYDAPPPPNKHRKATPKRLARVAITAYLKYSIAPAPAPTQTAMDAIAKWEANADAGLRAIDAALAPAPAPGEPVSEPCPRCGIYPCQCDPKGPHE